jgi:hypothetical protein
MHSFMGVRDQGEAQLSKKGSQLVKLQLRGVLGQRCYCGCVRVELVSSVYSIHYSSIVSIYVNQSFLKRKVQRQPVVYASYTHFG